MINLPTSLKGAFLIALLIFAGSDSAFADDIASWYLGADVGQATNSVNHNLITSGLANGGITTGGGLAVTSITDNNYASGYKIFGGYQLCKHLALEAGYVDFGTLGYIAYTNPSGALTGQLKAHGEFFDAVASYPVDERAALFVRGGLNFTQAESDFSNAGAVQLLRTSYSDNSTKYNLGLGASLKLISSLELRFEGERFRIDDGTGHQENINLLSLGLLYRF